jgi:RimJ/RimL family protein N-acetyltransferase
VALIDQLLDVGTRLAGRLELGWRTDIERYGLGRDLSVPIKHPAAKIPVSVRSLEERDIGPLFAAADSSADAKEKREAAVRRAFNAKGVGKGFVAIDDRSGAPCYVQWLFGIADSGFIATLGGFPPLKERQALLENAYTPVNYRGFGIMSAAMALIAERADDVGADEVLTFVQTDNIASLKGCQRAGFNPVMLHHSKRRAFSLTRQDSFAYFSANDPRRHARF